MISEMKNNAVDELKKELSRREMKSEQDLLEILPLAARLAALGESDQLDRCRIEAANEFGEKIDTLLLERAEEGLWDIDNALGEHLGFSIIEAQDFYCLMLIEFGDSAREVIEERNFNRLPAQSLIGAQAVGPMVNWIWECEDADLDNDVAGLLEAFNERFPLPEEFRIGIVDSPISIEQKEMLAMMARPRQNFTAAWSEALPKREALPMVADSGKPPFVLMRRYEVRKKTPEGTEVVVTRLINEDWEMLLDIHDPEENPLRIDLVRAGPRPAFPIQDSGGISWKIELADLPAQERLSAVFEPLAICFSNHTRLVINGRSD